MVGWLELAGVIFISIIGVFIGNSFARLKKYWPLGYLLPLIFILFLLLAMQVGLKSYTSLFGCIAAGRMRFVIIALSVTMGSMTFINRLTNRAEKFLVFVTMLFVVVFGSFVPFALPLIVKEDLSRLNTRTDADNICFQSTSYTCGPAAAVTALRQLGLSAQEGELAILSHTSPIIGTLPWSLCKAIQQRYGTEGINCSFRHFDSISQMKEADATLAIIRDAFMLDHCVAIIEVTDKTVTIGDPVLGKLRMSYKRFAEVWRFYGITLKYNPT